MASLLTLEQAQEEADAIINVGVIPEHPRTRDQQCVYLKVNGSCYLCCDACNYCTHYCGGCGTELDHNGYEWLYLGSSPDDYRSLKKLHSPPDGPTCYE